VEKLSLERVFKALVSLGLSEPDARVYIFLALKGPNQVVSIVDKLKINKKEIIRSLGNLQKKGIISQVDDAKGFQVLSFEKTLKLLIKLEKEQNTMMLDNLIRNWKTVIQKNSTD